MFLLELIKILIINHFQVLIFQSFIETGYFSMGCNVTELDTIVNENIIP